MRNTRTRILLLDDDLFHRNLLAEGLEEYYDFMVMRVGSLEAAKEEVNEFKPDLLLLDVVVGENRLDVIEWVRKMRAARPPSTTPVLFVTAYKEIMAQVESMEKTALLAKPFGLDEVTQKIRKLLGTAP